MMKIISMIPARMASTRYPGKPIVDICGKTMIEHVWQRVKSCKHVSALFIVTCDNEIREAAEKFGAEVIMTSNKHERCTDRIAEGCQKLLESGEDFDIVLNIQGDEPLLNPLTIDLLCKPFIDKNNIPCVNLIERLSFEEEIKNKNNVKVIFDQNNNALYFSRLPIPNGINTLHHKQLGIYGLTKETILQYSKMPQTPLEIAESVDMLRFVENGIPVKVVLSPYKTFGVDTPEDHKKVNALMEKDVFFKIYNN